MTSRLNKSVESYSDVVVTDRDCACEIRLAAGKGLAVIFLRYWTYTDCVNLLH